MQVRRTKSRVYTFRYTFVLLGALEVYDGLSGEGAFGFDLVGSLGDRGRILIHRPFAGCRDPTPFAGTNFCFCRRYLEILSG